MIVPLRRMVARRSATLTRIDTGPAGSVAGSTLSCRRRRRSLVQARTGRSRANQSSPEGLRGRKSPDARSGSRHGPARRRGANVTKQVCSAAETFPFRSRHQGCDNRRTTAGRFDLPQAPLCSSTQRPQAAASAPQPSGRSAQLTA